MSCLHWLKEIIGFLDVLYFISDSKVCIAQLLVGIVSSYRYDKELVDMNIASLEAAKLHEAIKRKQLDHDDIVYVLSTRNVYQLRATFKCYQQKFGNPIDQVQLL